MSTPIRESLIRRAGIRGKGDAERNAALAILRALTEAGEEPLSLELKDNEVRVTISDKSTSKSVADILKAADANVSPHSTLKTEYYISLKGISVQLTQSPKAASIT